MGYCFYYSFSTEGNITIITTENKNNRLTTGFSVRVVFRSSTSTPCRNHSTICSIKGPEPSMCACSVYDPQSNSRLKILPMKSPRWHGTEIMWFPIWSGCRIKAPRCHHHSTTCSHYRVSSISGQQDFGGTDVLKTNPEGHGLAW